MVQVQVFLKRGEGWGGGGGGGGEADTFPISFFQGLSFLHLEIDFLMYLKKNYFFL